MRLASRIAGDAVYNFIKNGSSLITYALVVSLGAAGGGFDAGLLDVGLVAAFFVT